ncbi:hypothetical protein C3Z09_16935 [Lelliottia aquatilis]|nr:hypothetical protein C3Z09_16935 [Lelliottia aquatilis]
MMPSPQPSPRGRGGSRQSPLPRGEGAQGNPLSLWERVRVRVKTLERCLRKPGHFFQAHFAA